MNIESYRDYCLSLKQAEEKMPFDDRVLVFTIKGKIFSLTDIDTFEIINVKCAPEEALVLREEHEGVIPGYHMNKKHWNSILTAKNIKESLIKKWIKDSYDLVVAGLPKKVQQELKKE